MATDAIVRDENALWSAGDRAYQAITGLQYIQEGLRVGALSGFRYPWDPNLHDAIWSNVELGSSCRYICHRSIVGQPATGVKLVGVWGRTTRLVNEATKLESKAIFWWRWSSTASTSLQWLY